MSVSFKPYASLPHADRVCADHHAEMVKAIMDAACGFIDGVVRDAYLDDSVRMDPFEIGVGGYSAASVADALDQLTRLKYTAYVGVADGSGDADAGTTVLFVDNPVPEGPFATKEAVAAAQAELKRRSSSASTSSVKDEARPRKRTRSSASSPPPGGMMMRDRDDV